SNDDFVLSHLPLYLALLPYMGPLSMAVLLVKVFRERDAGHFWHVQGLGLIQITLGCVLDGGPDFGAMMTVYLASALACLALHYRLSALRIAESRLTIDDSKTRLPIVNHQSVICNPNPLASRRWLLSFTLRWTLLIAAMSLLLFLLTPRRDNWSWRPLNKIRSGYSRGRLKSDNEEMNLNDTGRIELDDEIALYVTAVDAAGRPKLDLSADQRWRGSVLDWYEHGKWATMHLAAARPAGQSELPDFGPDQFFLTFTVQPRQAGGLVLAEPIRFGTFSARLPVIPLLGESRRRLFAEFSGTVLPQVFSGWRREYRYRQVVPAQSDPSRIPAEGIGIDRELTHLTNVPTSLQEPLQDWTIDLLRRLSRHPRYHLPPGVRAALAKRRSFPIDREHWGAVALLLTDYLANSGEYTYSLELTRHNRTIDPVLDFLINVKQGHCERYAAALALMLRSVGIPARVVKGFHGCDKLGNGQYVVRHSHAHAWVEALVPHKEGRGARGEGRENTGFLSRLSPLASRPSSLDWLTLDATPPEAPPVGPDSSLSYLWSTVYRFCQQRWRALIVEYNGEEQTDLWVSLKSGRGLWNVLKKIGLAAGVFVAALSAWLILRRRRLRRCSAPIRADAAFYLRLVRIMGRYTSLRPRLGETPREYGTAAKAMLHTRPALAGLAELPRRAIELFYRVRFGGRPLKREERQEIDAELDRFAEALHRYNRGPKGSAGPPRSPSRPG
ncbi:MAG TPA: transglutaminase domain-containing protein, partial [Gemmataceae bacterium]|nr:transglutaminase domain-containing protein [Gemmataceae bacterium]